MTTTPRARPVEYVARELLASHGYHALRFNGSGSPVNLVGIGDRQVLLVQVRRARPPVSGVREVHERYRRDMELLRKIGGPRCCRRELWVCSGRDGFRFYEIFPGGLAEIPEP